MNDAQAATLCAGVVDDVFARVEQTHQLQTDDVRTPTCRATCC
jgi:hypothetical protein